MMYCRSLRFDEKPDYTYLRKIFRDVFVREGYTYDYVFDWTILKYVNEQTHLFPSPYPPDSIQLSLSVIASFECMFPLAFG